MTTDKSSAHERAMQEIDDAVRAFFARGYYAARNPWRGSRSDYTERRKQLLIPDNTVRKIVRRVAKERKALWVDVDEDLFELSAHPASLRHRIAFTRNRRSHVLAAPLLPIAVERTWGTKEGSPVTSSHLSSLWKFYFHGDDGDKIFRRWCERLQTDPTFIKALGFTPTGNPLLDPKESADDASRLAA